MNILKAMFSAPKALEAIIAGGDKIVFTKEEQFDAMHKMASILGPQNIARRVISIIVTSVWVMATINTATLLNLVVFTDIVTLENIKPFLEFYGYICLIFGGIMTFYFGMQFKRGK